MDDMTFLLTMLGSPFSKGQTAKNPRSYAQTINTNITGVALMMATFLHLMKEALRRSSDQHFFPSRLSSSIIDRQSPTIEGHLLLGQQHGSQRFDHRVRKGRAYWSFHAAMPGHCKTAFNGLTGTKHPLDGVRVVAEQALVEKEKYENGFGNWKAMRARQAQCRGGS